MGRWADTDGRARGIVGIFLYYTPLVASTLFFQRQAFLLYTRTVCQSVGQVVEGIQSLVFFFVLSSLCTAVFRICGAS